jgi:serine/threonine protein kinase
MLANFHALKVFEQYTFVASNVVHRDLKPRNLLINSNCCLKVADYGLSRVYTGSNNSKIAPMTDYVTTRWYRAPEIIVGWPSYTAAVDMWAVGCIIAELIVRTPLFPGTDTMRQLETICGTLGKPDSKFIRKSRKQQFSEYLMSMPDDAIPTDSLAAKLSGGNPKAIHMCLQ